MISPTLLTDARVQLHYAIQGIAATGMIWAEAQPDGRQMISHWQPALAAFVGQPLRGEQSVYAALAPVSLTSLILDERHQAIAALPLAGKTLAELLDWHQAKLTQLGLRSERLALLDYPDDFPRHPLAYGAPFGGTAEAYRRAIADYFAHSRLLLQSVVTAQAGASPLHIWPHHFDMATLITLSGSGETARTIGVGLSPGDQAYNQPYWYVSPWPYPTIENLPALSVGHWHTSGWVGAILVAEAVDEPASESTQQTIRTFLDEAVEMCHIILEATVHQ
ncbi:MAG: hypothetical protein AAGF98_11620 [Cyanobacteria bacterium P01_H01_bin.153]